MAVVLVLVLVLMLVLVVILVGMGLSVGMGVGIISVHECRDHTEDGRGFAGTGGALVCTRTSVRP